jgi:Protein of unknown function (DUF2690)
MPWGRAGPARVADGEVHFTERAVAIPSLIRSRSFRRSSQRRPSYARQNHRNACVPTENLQILRQLGTETHDSRCATRVTLRLRYSPGCQSEWATVTDVGRPDGAVFWIYDRGTHALEVATTERATFTRQWQTTRMVGVARTKARACIAVRTPHGLSAPACTPFIGH